MKKDVYELTNPQKNIWELEQINGDGTPINHILSIFKLKGNLKEDLFAKTMQKIVEVNDSFRLRFIRNNNTLYQYVEDYQPVHIDIIHLTTEDISAIIEEYKTLEVSLKKPFRFCLVFTPSYSYLIYKSHHLISDAWSMSQVAEQIKDFYEKLSKGAEESAF